MPATLFSFIEAGISQPLLNANLLISKSLTAKKGVVG